MAGSSFFLLIDDIATLLDDVAVMSKVAVKKTAGVLGDDLALNANQVSGVTPDRELPVVWAVAKGSVLNKVILVPLALVISVLLPSAIGPLLIVGGIYLCFEGVEKLAHAWLHSEQEDIAHTTQLKRVIANPAIDLLAYERDKIKGAIRTDFILSAEIIVITLGTVATASLPEKIAVMSIVAAAMTVVVYGLVAAIVRLDDFGLHQLHIAARSGARWRHWIGVGVIRSAPKLMRLLSVVGTAAMFLVGGGIVNHEVPWLHHAIDQGIDEWVNRLDWLSWLLPSALNLLTGLTVGIGALAAWTLAQTLLQKYTK